MGNVSTPVLGSGRERLAEIHARAEALVGSLVGQGVLSLAQVERGRRAMVASGERLDTVLNKLGLISDVDLARAYAQLTGFSLFEGGTIEQAASLPAGVDASFFRHRKIIPLAGDGGKEQIVVADPLDLRAVEALAALTGQTFRPVIGQRSDIDAALGVIAGSSAETVTTLPDNAESGLEDVERLKDIASEAPVIRLVAELIEAAAEQGASDLHITRNAEGGRVRFRVDGRLQDVRLLTPRLHQAVVSRLKIMAALDIGERRLPQDGRLQVPIKGREVDLRISTMPHAHGEGVFVRILDSRSAVFELSSLGFHDAHVRIIESILRHAFGLFLITGPTGSGKTTTLYAALQHLNDPSKNIVTVEDPVEYTLSGINQIQVNRPAGLDFPRTLRSVLRQDPDVIMVGEIRDRETAAIAVQAALTGHFVLATLHTNNALSAVDRLVDMGVEPFLLASVLRGVMAQRLVRQLCRCEASGADHRPEPGSTTHRTCSLCHGTGYAGRTPLLEVVPIGPELQTAIGENRAVQTLISEASELGFASLEEDGERLIADGKTTRAEILRALGGS